MISKTKVLNKFRMIQHLVLAAILYAIAAHVTQPQLQIVLWKAGHITVGAFMGYWIDRTLFKTARIDESSVPMEHVRRAIIVAAAILAVAMGL